MSSSEYDIERGVYQTPSNDDDLYDDYDDDEGFGRGPVFAIFAVIVLAAFFGVVWLAYQAGLRQGGAAQPPIISASSEPFRTEPADPQGMQQPETTLVDDAIAGQPMDQVAEVTPSSEQPIQVPRNQPSESQAASSSTTSSGSNSGSGLRPSNTTSTSGSGLSVPPPSSRVQNATVGEDLRGSQSATNTRPTTSQPSTSTQQPATQQPSTTTTRPTTSNTGSQTASSSQSSTQGPPAPTTTQPAATTGNYVIQVGSFPEQDDAAEAWARLQSRHGGIVGGYQPDVQSADLGERGIWYRLRFGYFESNSAAASVCSQLQSAGQDCLVRQR